FAFTGNKFEFRSVASSMSIAGANTVLNTIVADVLCEMADELEKATDFDQAVHDLIKKTLTEHQRVIFNGNGYSDEWVAEAERRGLPNLKSMVDAIPSLVTDKSIEMFSRLGVLTETELHSRVEINYELYSKVINIEAKTMIEMASRKYVPSVIAYVKSLADSINAVKTAVPTADVTVQSDLLIKASSLLAAAQAALVNLQKVDAEGNAMEDGKEKAVFFKDIVFAAMNELRAPIDELEVMVDKKFWPVPTYADLLFEV
ncbi:MAG: glutamine synthetase type III, partial [bacterium]|nr:glutamine synthetase type III [bacterium]